MPQECKIGKNSMFLGSNSSGLSLAGPFLLMLCGVETDAFYFFPPESNALNADRMKTITMHSGNRFCYKIRIVAMMSSRCHWLFPQNKRGITRKLQNLVTGHRRESQLLRENSGLRLCDRHHSQNEEWPRLPSRRRFFARLLGPRTLLFLLLAPGCSPGLLSGSFGG